MQVICQDKVLALTHGTSMDYLHLILSSGVIKAAIGDPPRELRGYQEVLNRGAYTQMVFHCNRNKVLKRGDCGKDVILVLSTSMLALESDYHVTNNWVGGMVFSPAVPGKTFKDKSYTPTQLQQFLIENTVHNCTSTFTKNEVVFSKDIDLRKYLMAIWICDHDEITTTHAIKNPSGNYSRAMIVNKKRDVNVLKHSVERFLQLFDYPNVDVEIVGRVPATRYNKYCTSTPVPDEDVWASTDLIADRAVAGLPPFDVAAFKKMRGI